MTVTADQVLTVLHAIVPIIAMLVAMPIFPQWTRDALKVAEAFIDSDALRSLLHLLLGEQAVVNSVGDARTKAIHEAAQALATPDDKAALEAAGIDWPTFLQYLPQIVTLILSALGLRR